MSCNFLIFSLGYCERAERMEDPSMHIKLEKRQGKDIEMILFLLFICRHFTERLNVLLSVQGYTIPLDKRLAADGRGLQQVHINENFAKLAEALYIADRKVRLYSCTLVAFFVVII